MAQTLELPNGTTITDIRSDATADDVKNYLIKENIDYPANFQKFLYEVNTPARQRVLQNVEEFQVDEETFADYITPVLELGLGIPAATIAGTVGAGLGYAYGGPLAVPPVAGAFATTASSAAVFGANFIGENLEALIEGRKLNPQAALSQAVDAAQTDALISSALGTVGLVGGTAFKIGKQVIGGKKGLPDEEIELIQELQAELKEMGSTLQPQMVEPNRAATEIIGSFAKVSQITKRTVDNLVETYGTYMGKQTEQLVTMFKGGTPGEQGQAVQALVAQVDTALDEIVAPMYAQISKVGKGVTLDLKETAKDRALSFKRENYRRDPKVNEKTGEVSEDFGGLKGKAKAVIEEIENYPSNLTFSEAHQRLSSVKRDLHAARTASTKDPQYIKALSLARDVLQDGMNEGAERLSPSLQKQYKDVSDYYAQGQKVVTDTFLEKAMDVLDPSQIGALMTTDGFTLGVDQINTLKKLALKYADELPDSSLVGDKLAKELRANDPIEGMRKGFLEQVLKFEGAGGAQSVRNFAEQLKDPKFRATFKHLFAGTPVDKKINVLIDKLDILERGASGGAGFQLTVAGAEQGAAKAVASEPFSITQQFVNFLPGLLARKNLKVGEIDKTINLISAATAAQRKGVKLDRKFEDILKSTMLGVKIGVGLGAFL